MKLIELRVSEHGDYALISDSFHAFELTAGKKRLNRFSTEAGSWPLVGVEKDGKHSVVMLVFLSSAVVQWPVSASGTLGGSHRLSAPDIEELAEALKRLRPGVVDGDYLLARSVQGRVDLAAFGSEEFQDPILRKEHELLSAMTADASIPDDLRTFIATHNLMASRRFERVPFTAEGAAARQTSELLGTETAKEISDHAYLHLGNAELREKPETDVEFWWPASPLRPLVDFGGYSPKLGIAEINLDVSGPPADSAYCATVTVTLPISARRPEDTQILRIRAVLRYWLPYLAEHYIHRGEPYALKLSCRDSGSPGMLSMDHNSPKTPLYPDLYAMNASGFSYENVDYPTFRAEFDRRKTTLFWRGSTTGPRIKSHDDLLDNLRIKICVEYGTALGSHGDLKISRIRNIEPSYEPDAMRLLIEKDVIAPLVTEDAFGSYKMALDLPGVANSWGTIRKYLLGILVLRARRERYLYYYRYLRPWENFIPVRADASDIGEKVDWVRQNPDRAAKIAFNGMRMAQNYVRNVPTLMRDIVAQNSI
ncbi:MAG: glycosyl transferase family 90 [Pseudomonadota bacterium]